MSGPVERWRADFLDSGNVPDLDRRKWGAARDLVVEVDVPAAGRDPRALVFAIARASGLREPFLGRLEKVSR